VILYLFNF